MRALNNKRILVVTPTFNNRGKYRAHFITLKGIIVFLIAAVCLSASAAEPDQQVIDESIAAGRVIDEVATAGNFYISQSKILASARSKPGQAFSPAEAKQDVARIAKITGIEYAYYNLTEQNSRLILTYVIKEKNVIRQITFTGNQKYSDKKLTEEIGFGRGDYLDKFSAAAGANKIEEYYQKKGYPFVEVTFDDSKIDMGRLQYDLKEGPRVKIKKTYFQGNDNISRKELLKAIKSKPKTFLVIQNYFSQEKLNDDAVKIQEAYDRQGYLDTAVSTELNYVNDRRGVEITFNISQGSQYIVEDILVRGNTFIDDANLLDESRLETGLFYSDEKAKYDAENMTKAYRSRGFIDAMVKNSRRFSGDDKITAVFDVTEAGRYRIGRVNISGNKDVQDRVVRRILDEEMFTPGRWYDAAAAEGTGKGDLEEIVKSNIYAESITITPAGDDPNTRDAQVRITEGKTGSIIFGAGISSTDGAIGQVVYEQRNFDAKKWPKNWRKFFSEDAFKGAGQRFRMALEPGTQISRYSISFTEPYLNDMPTSMNIAGSSWQRGRESYDEERLSGNLNFRKRLKKGKFRGIGFRFENVEVVGLESDAPSEVKDVEGDNWIGGVEFSFGRNATDNRLNPTEGFAYEMSYEQIGGDHTFGVLRGEYRKYKVLREDLARRKTILELKFAAGAIVGDAPVFEKFYAGGSGSVRGFAYRGISDRAGPDDDPIGSDWIGTASAEVVIPIASDNFAGLLFADSGIIDTGGVRAAVGIGIQIMIPQWFGKVPMRFEVATPMLKDGDDETEFFSFSVGRLF